MKKRIIVIHGWGGSPDKDWMPWAFQELSKKGYRVSVLTMPKTYEPKIDSCVKTLDRAVGYPDENTVLIGHSIGCQTILRYLQTLQDNQKVEKVILVAGWTYLTNEAMPTPEDKLTAKPWLETPINYKLIRSKANSFMALFSDNDPFVDYEPNSKVYEEKLGAKIILVHDSGHFNESTLPYLVSLL